MPISATTAIAGISATDMTTDEPDAFCVSCGMSLGDDLEDDPDGEGPGRPICGECDRARNFEALELDLDDDANGSID